MQSSVLALAFVTMIAGAAVPAAADAPPLPAAAADSPGTYGWGSSADAPRAHVRAAMGDVSMLATCAGFDAGTFCQTGWGWQWFGARVINGVITFRAWSNLFNVPDPCPLSFTFDFGDGTSELAPGTSTDSSSYVQVTHKYAQAGPYTVGITASNGTSTLSCTMTTITVVPCWQDGVLCYQGEKLVWNRSGSSGVLDIDPPVRINQTLYASGHSRVEYTYDGSTLQASTFRPTGQLYVPGLTGDSVLFEQAPAFDVRWKEGTLHLLDASVQPFDFRPGGLPIWAIAAPLTVGPSHVVVQPVSVIGVAPGAFEIARFSSTWRQHAGGALELLGFAFVSNGPFPSMTLGEVTMTYEPPPADTTAVKMSAQLPFSGLPSFAAEFKLAPCGLNMADVTLNGLFDNAVPIAAYGPFTLGISGWRSALDHACDGKTPILTVAGNLEVSVAGVPTPGEFFSIENVGLTYEHPLDFRLLGGTAKALGFDVGQVTGFVRGAVPPLGVTTTGTVNIAGAFVGRATQLLSLGRLWVSGSAVGVSRIPDYSCAWYDQPCKAIRALARAALGGLPYEVNGQSFHIDGSYSQKLGSWQANYIGELTTRSGPIVMVVQVLNGTASVLVGTNMENLFGISVPLRATAARSAAERSVTIPAGIPGVTFAATGAQSTPALVTLLTPDGRTLTPQAPGVALYATSAADQTALYEVPYPEPGTWTLRADGAPGDEVVLLALVPRAKPSLSFERVEHVGSAVEIEATVAPPSATTRVQLFFGATAAGGMGEPIGEPLAAAAGTVAATWDVSTLAPGTYFLFAQAAEEGTFPVTVYAPAPIVIGGTSPLDAPTGLAGSRDGDTASLTWTPATAPEAVAHAVLYTDRPEVAGYPYSQAAPMPGEAAVSGLESSRGYRFAVVAVDAQGAHGPPSNEIVLAGSGAACALTCGAAVAEAAARREFVAFTGTVAADGCATPPAVEWVFGDGAAAMGTTVSHAYAAGGSYSWQMTARSDAVTCSSSGTISVSASDPPPRRRLRRHL